MYIRYVIQLFSSCFDFDEYEPEPVEDGIEVIELGCKTEPSHHLLYIVGHL